MKKKFIDRLREENPEIFSALAEATSKTVKSIKKDQLKMLKERIKYDFKRAKNEEKQRQNKR